jgi:hypothetical protein
VASKARRSAASRDARRGEGADFRGIHHRAQHRPLIVIARKLDDDRHIRHLGMPLGRELHQDRDLLVGDPRGTWSEARIVRLFSHIVSYLEKIFDSANLYRDALGK